MKTPHINMDHFDHLKRLEEAVRDWLLIEDQKKAAMEAFNEDIKRAKEDIRSLASECADDHVKPKLPLGEEEAPDET